MAGKRCLCAWPLRPCQVERVNPPWCPEHGGTGKWKVILK